MNGEAARIADVGDMVKQLQIVDKPPTCFQPAFKLEAQQAAVAAVQVLVGALPLQTRLQGGVDHLRHLRVLGKPCGNRLGVLAVLLHAQRQRLNALNELEGVER